MSMTNYEVGKLCGWYHMPAAVEQVVSELPMPTFAESSPHLKGTGTATDVYFWKAEETVLGKVLASYHQKIGDCVSMGMARSAQDLLLIEILLGEYEEIPKPVLGRIKNESGEHGIVATEPIYGGSRVEVGGGRIRGDGSIGAWAAKWVTKWGIILRMPYEVGGDKYDLSKYSPERARDWGRRGCPDPLEPEAKLHPIETFTQLRSYEEIRDHCANLYPVTIASDQGFAMKRSPGGWCKAVGRWMHQMCVRGHLIVKGNKPALIIQNSWGDYLGDQNNVVTLETGQEVTLPPGCFLCEPEVGTRIARQGDTFSYTGAQGWPRRDEKVPWIFTDENVLESVGAAKSNKKAPKSKKGSVEV